MADYKDDAPWAIPERFRASADLTDEAAHALLLRNNEEQKALAQKINAPFTHNSPKERERAKAYIVIRTLAGRHLGDDQREMLAEAYASVGRYDLAADTSALNKELYETIWAAVFRDDAETCDHPDQHHYVSQQIFSLRHSKEMTLVKCRICGFINVKETPGHLAAASAYRRQFRGATRGMDIHQARAWHEANVRKG